MVRDIPDRSRSRLWPAQEVFSDKARIREFAAYQDIGAPMLDIRLLVPGEIVGMSHDPLTMWGALPGQDGFGRVYRSIDFGCDVASKEVDLHGPRTGWSWEIPAR